MTMELSTTIPMANESPARLTTLMFRPMRVITRKVPTALMGMATAMITVLAKLLKKMSSTAMARAPPMKMLCRTRLMALYM